MSHEKERASHEQRTYCSIENSHITISFSIRYFHRSRFSSTKQTNRLLYVWNYRSEVSSAHSRRGKRLHSYVIPNKYALVCDYVTMWGASDITDSFFTFVHIGNLFSTKKKSSSIFSTFIQKLFIHSWRTYVRHDLAYACASCSFSNNIIVFSINFSLVRPPRPSHRSHPNSHTRTHILISTVDPTHSCTYIDILVFEWGALASSTNTILPQPIWKCL